MSSNDALAGYPALLQPSLIATPLIVFVFVRRPFSLNFVFTFSFANSGLITVGALFIIVHTMGRTQVVSNICHKVPPVLVI